jgi:hypothetical protein
MPSKSTCSFSPHNLRPDRATLATNRKTRNMNRENVKQILINQRVKRIKLGVYRKLLRAESVNTSRHSVKE